MSDPTVVLKKLRENRKVRAELESAGADKPAKVIVMLRPPEAHFPRFLTSTHSIEADSVLPYVVGWEGITEEDLLGAGVGASDAVPFSQELFAEVANDKVAWLVVCANALIKAIEAHVVSLKESRGN